ncbi:putative bifunctional diguanylate cyclase/phosphodiesterase [Rhizorhapis suberifaciens]|uniref:Diguanylate cyclase (GGDEF)-like protein n=1 Tax=Rhizorhapis suberifaciens TaxID=13656 RepID=A0A840HRX2_9SPHN|nr:bifunctional diguanylate cyclase/phosphodiesterase [Rhizorhapis suberifaciens]MBB4640284.1 diguanylate cyclase (GGDEF)-like protein [Rhizorhapis suberifaciens]
MRFKGAQARAIEAAIIPFQVDGAIPDWLSALPFPAAIFCFHGNELTLESYNGAFAGSAEGTQRWLKTKGAGYPEQYSQVMDFARSDQQSCCFEWLEDGPLAMQLFFMGTMARLTDGPDGKRRFLSIMVDRTSERQTEKNLRRELISDSLTGLPNRAGFGEDIDARCSDTQFEPISQYAILAIDLVRFSRINESLGAMAGDELIITVARRLKSSLRQGDILARLGGNEFGIFVRLSNGLSDALQIVQRINTALAAPCRLSDLQISIDVAIGCSISTVQNDSDEILRQAQVAMKLAKKSGKLEIYRPGVLRQARDRFDLESKLRHALANGQLRLAYHPLVDLHTGAVTGFEALARWQDPDRGVISPAEFIPVAEESGLIIPLGRWAMHEALQSLAQWDRQYGRPLPVSMSVNLSPIQMARDDVPEVAEEALRYSGISGQRLTVELTESAIIADPDKARQVLTALKAQDISVAMDDFGTGFSNLASLHRLPIDILKIDRSFVTEMLTDKDKCAIVRAILSLAKSLKLKTTAEGIESAELGKALAHFGCNHGQGFHFGEPISAAEAYEFWLSRNS